MYNRHLTWRIFTSEHPRPNSEHCRLATKIAHPWSPSKLATSRFSRCGGLDLCRPCVSESMARHVTAGSAWMRQSESPLASSQLAACAQHPHTVRIRIPVMHGCLGQVAGRVNAFQNCQMRTRSLRSRRRKTPPQKLGTKEDATTTQRRTPCAHPYILIPCRAGMPAGGLDPSACRAFCSMH
jgi:hypothetical protein